MEKTRISGWQLFVLITLFEIGSAFLVGLAMDSKQDAWIAILVGMISSYALIFMYYRLHRYYPDLALTEYIEKLLEKCRDAYLLFFTYYILRMEPRGCCAILARCFLRSSIPIRRFL